MDAVQFVGFPNRTKDAESRRAPLARKPPITFNLTLVGRTILSAKLLSSGTRQSVRNRQIWIL